jgi:hypothetical protein
MNTLTRDRIITVVWTVLFLGSALMGEWKTFGVVTAIGALLAIKELAFPTDYTS